MLRGLEACHANFVFMNWVISDRASRPGRLEVKSIVATTSGHAECIQAFLAVGVLMGNAQVPNTESLTRSVSMLQFSSSLVLAASRVIGGKRMHIATHCAVP